MWFISSLKSQGMELETTIGDVGGRDCFKRCLKELLKKKASEKDLFFPDHFCLKRNKRGKVFFY